MNTTDTLLIAELQRKIEVRDEQLIQITGALGEANRELSVYRAEASLWHSRQADMQEELEAAKLKIAVNEALALRTDEEKKHNRELQKLLAASMKDAQTQTSTLTAALDRVLVSKFDPPLMPQPREQANNLSFPDVSDVLSIEDDAAFIETMEKAIA